MPTTGEKLVHHAVAWQVVDYQQEPKKGGVSNRNFDGFRHKGELGELPSAPHSYVQTIVASIKNYCT